jgi:hypothetical protein
MSLLYPDFLQIFVIQERVFACIFTGLCTVADARCFNHFGFAPRCAELRCLTRKKFQTVENDREKIFVEYRLGSLARARAWGGALGQ